VLNRPERAQDKEKGSAGALLSHHQARKGEGRFTILSMENPAIDLLLGKLTAGGGPGCVKKRKKGRRPVQEGLTLHLTPKQDVKRVKLCDLITRPIKEVRPPSKRGFLSQNERDVKGLLANKNLRGGEEGNNIGVKSKRSTVERGEDRRSFTRKGRARAKRENKSTRGQIGLWGGDSRHLRYSEERET